MVRVRWIHVLLLGVALAAFAAVLVLPGMSTGVLFLSPAIVLLASLLIGRYPGDERLARLTTTICLRRPRRPRIALQAPRPRRVPMPRGGRLVATSLAVRPPPAVLALHEWSPPQVRTAPSGR
ncbi:MAG TPA: hypothetical protein VGO80_23175 [Solirubrobacteraceae bacterium]|jgi:hypothetical protein|nr:hypothetical protein [Solirubrobacteraceae bacterium]